MAAEIGSQRPQRVDAAITVEHRAGEGSRRSARVFLVGEQPGNDEDRQGKPFVGPAGRVLDRGLEEAGIERVDAYVTNVVKHFKWVAQGKRRLHKTPSAREIAACLPWLEKEIELIKPQVLVCLRHRG
jgi:DNA polymerase